MKEDLMPLSHGSMKRNTIMPGSTFSMGISNGMNVSHVAMSVPNPFGITIGHGELELPISLASIEVTTTMATCVSEPVPVVIQTNSSEAYMLAMNTTTHFVMDGLCIGKRNVI